MFYTVLLKVVIFEMYRNDETFQKANCIEINRRKGKSIYVSDKTVHEVAFAVEQNNFHYSRTLVVPLACEERNRSRHCGITT